MFVGKSVLVTGSSRGIGKVIAESFLAMGAHVAFNGRNQDSLSSIVSSHNSENCIAVRGDVSMPDTAQLVIDKVLDSFGQLDILVCNVGSGRSVSPGSESHDEWLRVFEQNFWSTTNIVQASKEALFKSKGCIVCISSICGQEVIPGAPVTYSSAKAALNAYVRGIARPFGQHGVRINAISPGNILFDESVWQSRLIQDPNSVQEMLDRETSLGTLGSPSDVSNLVLWLCSPNATFCTGNIYVVDGGQVRS